MASETLERLPRASNDPNFPFYHEFKTYSRGLDNIYLVTGDESYLQDLLILVQHKLDHHIHQTLKGFGTSDDRGYTLTVGAIPMILREVDFVLGGRAISQKEKQKILSQLAFLGYLYSYDVFWPVERGYNMGNTNMTLGVYATLGKIGCSLKTHPMAEEWAKSAIKGINVSLDNHHLPDTTQDEWYGHLTLDMITQAGVFLKTAGFHNVFDDLRYKYGLDFYGQLLTPTDPRCNARYIAPFDNGQATWNRSAVWGIAAYMMKESHPNFSERMQYYWKRAGMPVGMKIGDRSNYGWMSLG